MGSLLGNVCFETNAQAVDAYYSGREVMQTAGSTSYRQWYEKEVGVWVLKRQSIASNGAVTNLANSTAPVPVFPVCDPQQSFTDGIALGWLLVGVMVLAWGAVMVRRQLT